MNHERGLWDRVKQLQLGVLIAIVFTVGYLAGTTQSVTHAQSTTEFNNPEAEEAFGALRQAYNMIEMSFVDEVETSVLVDGAIRGMMEALDDPYSNYVGADLYEFVNNDLNGEIEGIGVVITELEDTGEIEIISVLDDTPAAESGLQAGDVFYAVNGEEVIGLTNLELAARVRGPAGTTVNLTMRRGDEFVDFVVRRERILVPNVAYELLEEENISYISMAQFSSLSRQQVDEALAALDVNSTNGLIFDIRNNGGGYLTAAVDIAGLFIEEGTLLIEEFGDGTEDIFKIIGNTAYRIDENGEQVLYSTRANYAGIDVPVVILVNELSASASELVSGAWQDNGVATIIGTTTFGKGTVQIQNQLVNGGGIRLTVARWLTPQGEWISERGVTPDLIVEIPEATELAEGEDPQLDAAIQFILGQSGE